MTKYIIIDNDSGEEAVNHDGSPVDIYGSTVTIEDYHLGGDEYETNTEDLGEGRFYLEKVDEKEIDTDSILDTAVTFCMGNRLRKLTEMCDNPGTVTANELKALIEELAEEDRLHALYLKTLAKEIGDSN